MQNEWIDLSLTIDEACMTCGTPWHVRPSIRRLGRLNEVGRNTASILLGSHTATHLDAPLHFFDHTYGVDQIPLEKLCGEIQIVDFSNRAACSEIQRSDVEALFITPKMLFKFLWCRHWKTPDYYQDFPFFSLEALEYLVDHGLQMLALDTPSPDPCTAIGSREDSLGHKLLLKNNVVIVEYLTNTGGLVPNVKYEFMALPLKLKDADGSPCRAIIRRM